MINIALDVCVGRKRRERLEQMGYKIVVIAQPSEADKDWLNRAFAEGAFFVVSADLDIPKLIEREKYPMCWVEYPNEVAEQYKDQMVEHIDSTIKRKTEVFKQFVESQKSTVKAVRQEKKKKKQDLLSRFKKLLGL